MSWQQPTNFAWMSMFLTKTHFHSIEVYLVLQILLFAKLEWNKAQVNFQMFLISYKL